MPHGRLRALTPARRFATLSRMQTAPSTAHPWLDGLNDPQRKAVQTLSGPLLVLSGAGTGKTRVLTSRLAELVATGEAKPWNILAVTFTNKAAREMKMRVASMVGPMAEQVWLGTFHALAARMLRRHADLVGLRSDFTILDMDDQNRVLKQLMEADGIDPKRWPALGIDAVRLHQLFEDAVLVIHVENGEITSQTHKIGMPSQHPRGKRMECAEPNLFCHRPNHAGDPHLHLARRLVGEGHRKDVPWLGLAGGNQFCKARCEYPGLASSGAREHQQRTRKGLHCLALRVVQAVKPGVGCRRGCLHARQSRKSPGGGQRPKPAMRHLTRPAGLDCLDKFASHLPLFLTIFSFASGYDIFGRNDDG